ncbi:MAG: N-acyl homoserine lactonase family protein [Xanthobacteraceae bacterium]
MRFACIAALAAAVMVQTSSPAVAQGAAERLYVIECGYGDTADLSRWSPGVNIKKKQSFVTNCYLVRHAQGYLLWELGVGDHVAKMPEGRPGAINWRLKRTLASQLAEIGVKPADIKFIAASHTHGDHIGNVALFPQSMLLVQKAEYEWPAAGGKPRFNPAHPVTQIVGDHDVFGDGSAVLLATPGHTPGHQSILLRLKNTGAILISGDAAHFQENWDLRRVPSFNFDVAKSLASMERIAAIVASTKAQLWIHHDKVQSDVQKKSPAFYD